MMFKAFARGRKGTGEIRRATEPVLEVLEGRLMLSTHRHRTATTTTNLVTGGFIRSGGTPGSGATLTDIKNTYGLSGLGVYSDQYPLYSNDGDGEQIAVIGASAATPQYAVDTFSKNEAIPLTNGFVIDPIGNVDPLGGQDPFGAVMSVMELEWAHAMAPFAHITFIEVPSVNGVIPPGDLSLGIQAAVKDLGEGGTFTEGGPINQILPGGAIDIGTSSTGEDPTLAAEFDALFSYKYNKIDSFIAPSGDTGGTVSIPADSPYVTSVGGTIFNYLQSVNGKNPQIASLYAGGGPSAFEALPTFQKGITVNGKKVTTRSGPDLAMVDSVQGQGVYTFYDPSGNESDSESFMVEGTSVGAALMTGVVANMNQLRYSTGLGPIGRDLNNQLYALYKQNASLYFTDITQGNNGFQAYRGFDYASGMGSPNFNELIPALAGIPAIQAVTVKAVGDQYASLTQPLSSSGVTFFSADSSNNILIANNYIVFAPLTLTNTQTVTAGGQTITFNNTAIISVPTLNSQIVRNADNTFSAYATAVVTNGTQVNSYRILITGRVTGTAPNNGIVGSFYTVNKHGHRISLGADSIFEGSFSSI